MKALIITASPLTSFDGKSLRLLRYAEVLSERGYIVEFMATFDHLTTKKFKVYETRSNTSDFFGVSKYVPLVSELMNALRLLRFGLSVLNRIVLQNYELVISSSSSPEMGSVAALVGCKIRRTIHIYDYDDLGPEMSMVMKGWKSSHPLVLLQFGIEKCLCSRAAEVITMSDLMKYRIMYRTNAPNVDVIFNTPFGADLSNIKPIMDRREELGIEKESFAFCYIGNVQRKIRGLEKIVGAVEILAKRKCEFVVLIIGSGAGLSMLQKNIQARKLSKHFFFTGAIETEKVISFVNASNVSLVLLPSSIIGDYMVPTKLFISLGLGKNVIASDSAEVKRVLGENAIYVRPDFSEEELARAMQFAIQKYGLTEVNHTFMRFFWEKYNWEVERNRFKGILDRAIARETEARAPGQA